MRRLRFIALVLLSAIVALLLALPLGLYWLGLNGVEGLPQKPSQLVSKERQAIVWKRARGGGVPRIDQMNPYSFAVSLVVKEDPKTPPDQLIAWWVASDYLLSHQRQKGMGWWHLCGAALTIWLTRNWTSEEILSAAVLLREPVSGEH